MELKDPVVVYTAQSDHEGHVVVKKLTTSGIPAYFVVDDPTLCNCDGGCSKQPSVVVERSSLEEAKRLIEDHINQKMAHHIVVECEECGESTSFSSELDGTTQHCPHCLAYVDVGELPWEDDYGEPDE